MQRTKAVSAIGFVFLTAGFAFGQKVKFDYDHNADFSKYKTFTWIKQPVTPKDPLMEQRIVDAVNLQLMARGLQLVDSNSNADLAVSVNVATQEKQTLNTFYDGFGGWGWGGVATTTVETYTEGTIVADLFDTRTKKIVWRGVATKEVSHKLEKASQQTEKAVEKLFRNFPPNGA